MSARPIVAAHPAYGGGYLRHLVIDQPGSRAFTGSRLTWARPLCGRRFRDGLVIEDRTDPLGAVTCQACRRRYATGGLR